jgi:L-erythro-3,5-diaminohexanoate dehydrogenase
MNEIRAKRAVELSGDAYGTHRVAEPSGVLPQAAWRLDADFSRIFSGEALLAVETLNLDAASFAQMEETARQTISPGKAAVSSAEIDNEISRIVERTVAQRGKQHNPVTGSGGMLLGTVLQTAPDRGGDLALGARVATLVSLTLTPLRVDRIVAVRRAAAQIDVEGEAVLFGSGSFVRVPEGLPEKLTLAVLDVAGAAPQVARRVEPGQVVVVLGGGGKSGILALAEARRQGGRTAFLVAVEAKPEAAAELEALGLSDAILRIDARDARGVRRAVLDATGGREADVTFSCVNVADAEMAAILATRHRGAVYFFAMSTSFTKAALGAEGVGKDVDLFIGNGFAEGHAEHTLALLRGLPAVVALFEKRYL